MVFPPSLPTRSILTILLCLACPACCGVSCRAVACQVAGDPVTVNPDTLTYDYHPSTETTADGSTWLAWHGYRDGQDSILARRVDAQGTLSPLQTLSGEGTAHSPPQLVASDDGVAVVWASMQDGRWQVVFRQRRAEEWQAAVTLSQAECDAVYPVIVEPGRESFFAAWSEHTNGRWRIRGCHIQGGRPAAAFDVSSGAADAFRPTLVVHDSNVWAFWDQYSRPNYTVYGRNVFPQRLSEERVSPAGEYCLTPTAISHPRGLHVAWLRKVDVVGGPGVVSQWHSFHAAIRNDTGWQPITTGDGDPQAAELTQGLMAQIEPKAVATGGYLGPRLRPMLVADDDRVWLLWERKSDHRGSTPKIAGDLVGRPSIDGIWQPPVVLHRGRIDYHVKHQATQSSIRVLASQLPRQGLRRYERFGLSLSDGQPFQQEEWNGWLPTELPVQAERTPRRTIFADGKTYQLFWADMHCHNGLTADAEGEPDEMHVYARDRANLDVVVFTNNDFYNVPLTQYDFELGQLFARTFSSAAAIQGTRPFLSLPGFEWTSRIPGVASASLDDSRNWLPPYQNASYPNHRSVIYPANGGPLVHFPEVGNDIAKLNAAVERAGGITLSQHPAFKLSGHPVEVGLELTSGWGNYIASRPQLFHDALNTGHLYGFTANGDTHRRAPGLSGALTGIYAEELTADSILDALRNRRCFATMGAQMFVDSRANDAVMGQPISVKNDSVVLNVNAIGTRPIVDAVLIRDGRQVYQVDGDGTPKLTTTFTDSGIAAGVHWYYWRIRQERDAPVLPGNLMVAHGHLAWSTPHWVTVD